MATSAAKKIVIPDQFNIVACDFSLNRPGFCLWTQRAPNDVDITTFYLDNKKIGTGHNGEKLEAIFESFGRFRFDNDFPTFFVREHAFNSRGSQYEIGIFEVVGLSDWWLYCHNGEEWNEIYPISIRKWMCGDSKADKKKVEACLEAYVGKRKYEVDDESDATAVAVAFLIMHEKMNQMFAEKKENKEKENDT